MKRSTSSHDLLDRRVHAVAGIVEAKAELPIALDRLERSTVEKARSSPTDPLAASALGVPVRPESRRPASRPGATISDARANTASNIGSVSTPVNVFCWLGWYEHSSARPSGRACSARWPNFGRGRRPSSIGHALESELAQHHDDAQVLQKLQLPGQVGGAGRTLARIRLVGRRRTVDRRRDVEVTQDQAVVAGGARRLGGVAGPVERGEEPIAGAVAGEHTPRPVGPVRGRRQADDAHMCARRHRTRARRDPNRSGPQTTPGARRRSPRAIAPGAGSDDTRPPPAGRRAARPVGSVRDHGAKPTMGSRACSRPSIAPARRAQNARPDADPAGPPRDDPHHRKDAARKGGRPAPGRQGSGPGRRGGRADRRHGEAPHRHLRVARSNGPARRPHRSRPRSGCGSEPSGA